MLILKEQKLRNFKFDLRAYDNAGSLTNEQLDKIDKKLKEQYPEGINIETLNDLFSDEFNMVLSYIGLYKCDNCKSLCEEFTICDCLEEN